MNPHRRTEGNRMSIYLVLLAAVCAALGAAFLWFVLQLFIRWITLD